MKPTRRTVAIGAAIAAGAALSGCGVSGTGTQGGTSATTAPGGKLTGELTFQTWNLKAKFSDYFNGLVTKFSTDNPGVKIRWIDQPAEGYADKLQADATNNTLPDVVNVDPGLGYPLAKAGVLLDMGQAAADAKKDFLPDAWTGYNFPRLKGTYALPWYLNTGPFFYNKKLFGDAGLDANKPPKSFEEMHQQALKLGERANKKFFMLGAIPTIADFGCYGIKAIDEEATKFVFNTPQAAKIVDAYTEMYKKGGLLPDSLTQTYVGTGKSFRAQQIAFASGSAYDLEYFKKEAPDLYANIGLTPPITNTGKANMFSQGIAVNAKSKSQAAAVAFAKFVTNAQNQLAFAKLVAIFPSTTGALDDPYFSKEDGTDEAKVRVAAAKQLRTAVDYTPVVWTEDLKVTLQREMADAIQGRQSSQQALDKAVEAANKRLKP